MNAGCDEFRDLLDGAALDSLDEPEASALEAHLLTCEPCRTALDGARESAALIGLSAPLRRMSDRGRAAVLDVVAREGRRPLRPFWALAAAAALLVAVGLGAWGAVLQRQVNDLKQNGVLGQLQPNQMQALLALALEPDVKRIDLTGAGEAAAARAHYLWYKGGPGLLMSDNLPAGNGGQTFQLWFDSGGTMTPAGTFKANGDGRGWLLVDHPPAGFDRLLVTAGAGSSPILESAAPE